MLGPRTEPRGWYCKNEKTKIINLIFPRLCCPMHVEVKHVISRFVAMVKHTFGALDSALRPRPDFDGKCFTYGIYFYFNKL